MAEHQGFNSEQSGDGAVGRARTASWPYETILAFSGNYVTRIKSSIFYWGALLAFGSGIAFLYNQYMVGGFLVLTLAPCLLLYPLIRLLFGGRDSVGAVITTAVVEEVVKGEIFNAIERSSRKKRR